ncbi:MAG: hypothetical protein K6G83_05250 [Lachnospiraceae bacterium]|nr:hypothetical protein [Lachnospiraceae bacterium]
MKGAAMVVPNEMITKMQSLSAEQMSAVASFVDQLALCKPIDILNDLCMNGSENPMTDAEVAGFVADVRKERHATCN